MTNPAVSVAMSVFDGERYLPAAIDSILEQDFADFEFLIVDDGSSDRSPSIIRDYAARDSRIRPVLRENRGLIASLNEMIALARAPLIARMDADDICLPERLSRQVAFMQTHPDHGVVGAWNEDIGEDGRPVPRITPDPPVTAGAVLEAIARGEQVICHPVVMFRRDVVRSVGGYHAAFRHCEDLDLWLRLASRTRLANIPEHLIKYRRSAGQITNRHVTELKIGSAVSQIAWRMREAGRPDPTEHLERLPPIDDLDDLFGQPGVAASVREQVALGLRYSREGMRGPGMDLILRHLRDGGRRDGMWRTVIRLVTMGEPVRALQLAAALATSRAAAS